jgi:molecular chaperone GrpE
MSDHPNQERAPDMETAKAGYAETGGPAVEPGGEGQPAEPGHADFEAFMRLAKENEELKDRALRLAAEMENLRRRTARDVHDARAYAIANFARDMLTVSDNLRRALDAVPAGARESGESGFATLLDGVELTERSMLSALERHGVKKLEPEGEKFDPNFHQAMFEVPNPDLPANTVVQVVQTGYVIGERVLRPAMVGVSKGGPKAAPAADAAQAAGDDAKG